VSKWITALAVAVYVVSYSAIACCVNKSAGPTPYFPELFRSTCTGIFYKVKHGGSTRWTADNSTYGKVEVGHKSVLYYTLQDPPMETYTTPEFLNCAATTSGALWHTTPGCMPCLAGYSYRAQYGESHYSCALKHVITSSAWSGAVSCPTQ
jgi:hypothetical protein